MLNFALHFIGRRRSKEVNTNSRENKRFEEPQCKELLVQVQRQRLFMISDFLKSFSYPLKKYIQGFHMLTSIYHELVHIFGDNSINTTNTYLNGLVYGRAMANTLMYSSSTKLAYIFGNRTMPIEERYMTITYPHDNHIYVTVVLIVQNIS